MRSIIRFMLAIILAIISTGVNAQFGTIVVYAPKGDLFTLSLSGSVKNSEPASRVESETPAGPTFKIKISFKDASIKEVSKLVFNKPHGKFFYKLERNAKGVFALESTSEEEMNQAVAAGSKSPEAEKRTTQEVKTETIQDQPEKVAEPAKPVKSENCEKPMTDADFAVSLGLISSNPIESSRLGSAKKMADKQCLTVDQIKQVIYIFDNESSRLNFAKYAYDHTYNRQDYREVKDALYTDKSKSELDSFLSNQK
jgi:hypothetical protein